MALMTGVILMEEPDSASAEGLRQSWPEPKILEASIPYISIP